MDDSARDRHEDRLTFQQVEGCNSLQRGSGVDIPGGAQMHRAEIHVLDDYSPPQIFTAQSVTARYNKLQSGDHMSTGLP
ncbi:MAG: hypothetical protein ABI835_19365 [Chloroflexota bacterium]